MISLVIYTDKLPPNVGGCANAFVIRILNKYKDDKGILEHEKTHVMQWWTGVAVGLLASLLLYQTGSPYWLAALIAGAALHPLLYAVIPQYRLWAEVQAYKVQARYYQDDRTEMFAGFIARNYGLKIQRVDAYALLNK